MFIPKKCVSKWLSISVEHASQWICSCLLWVFSIDLLDPVLIWNKSDCRMQPLCFHTTKTLFMKCFMSLCPSHKRLPRWCYNTGIIFTDRVIIVTYVFCRCDLTAVWWVPDHLSWLCLFFSGFILYAINNFVNESVLFRVNFVSDDWSSCICGLTFLDMPFI